MALEACEKLTTENPKLAPDDYADLVKALKKVVFTSQCNIMHLTKTVTSYGQNVYFCLGAFKRLQYIAGSHRY